MSFKKKNLHPKAAVLYKHHLFTVSFSSLLNEMNYFGDITGCRTIAEATALASDNSIHYLFIDYNFPENDMLSFIRKVAGINTRLYIIVVSTQENDKLISSIQQAGAHAFISKKSEKKEIQDCLVAVRKGDYYISPEIFHAAMQVHINRQSEIFTGTEIQVLQLIAAGQSIKNISAILNISTYTVRTHRSNMQKKVHAGNTAVLIKKAIGLGII